MNLFTSLDPAVKKLLGWKMGDEEEKWALRAVESLVKKMQKRKHHGYGTVEDLLCDHSPLVGRTASGVPSEGPSPRHLLSRVALAKFAVPSDASTADCMFPYDGRSEQICINPYHYHRIEAPGQSKASLPSSAAVSMPSSSSSFVPSSSSSVGTFFPPSSSLSSSSSPASSVSSVPSFGHISNYQQHHLLSIPSASPTAVLFTQSPSALSDDDDFVAQQQQRHIATIKQQLYQQQICCWCSVCYYELNSRIGEPFKVFENIIVIDGFTNPSSAGRICLGLLSNVNRNGTIENTRRHIGRGIRLMCTDKSVLLLNQSEAAVFVQSRNASFKYSLQPTAVCRVPPGATMLVFDYHLFAGMLEKAKEDGYQHVYDIVKMCFVRLSFVKGWGADYPRQDVTSTPCWLEIQLHQPMAWIDAALAHLDPPDHNGITSVS